MGRHYSMHGCLFSMIQMGFAVNDFSVFYCPISVLKNDG
jgi:hypothetical protein